MGGFVLLLLLMMMGRKRETPGAPSPATAKGPGTFPIDSTAAQSIPPQSVLIPSEAGPTVPVSAPAAPVAAAPRKGTGVLPGTPVPGFRPYVPTPSAVVARAQSVLASGALRVTEADPSGQFSKVLYQREFDPSSGRTGVTAWRPLESSGSNTQSSNA